MEVFEGTRWIGPERSAQASGLLGRSLRGNGHRGDKKRGGGGSFFGEEEGEGVAVEARPDGFGDGIARSL